jgi:hypothetical protein
VSDEKPPVCSPNEVLSRIANERAEDALGSSERGIISKPVRYVIHIRDSKSSRKAGGHPPSCPGSSYASDDSKLLAAESGGVVGVGDVVILETVGWSASAFPEAWRLSFVSAVGGVLVVLSLEPPYVFVSSV